MDLTNPLEAKRFFIERIVSQAKKDRVPLSEVETQMLGFSVEDEESKQIELNDRFVKETTDEEFERKIVELLKKAYKEDKKVPTLRDQYSQARRTLAKGDHYISVMINGAIGWARFF